MSYREKPSLKKVNSELFRKTIRRLLKHHMINTCAIYAKECLHQEEKEACKNVKAELDVCSHCFINYVFDESEV